MSEASRTQQCTICGAVQPLSARTCSICGAVLPGEATPITPMAPVSTPSAPGARAQFDPAEGDDDLYAGDMVGQMWRGLVVGAVLIALVLGIGIGLGINQLGKDDGGSSDSQALAGSPKEPSRTASPPITPGAVTATGPSATPFGPTAPPTATARGGAQTTPTQTPTPRRVLPTVTPAPPTPTDTPTQGPCMQTAQQGDTVYGMAIRCGHLDLAVVDLILEINGMESATDLQLNQTLEIPWPTATPGGEPTEAGDDDGEGVSGAATAEIQYNEFGTPDAMAAYEVEPTLRPGQAWHTVQAGETILSIAILYSTEDYQVTVEILSQINPEVPFLQCDFGMASGGPNCSVMLYEGQRLRVPVPLPSPTATPSPVGTLTPTPTATATYNEPFLLGPDEGTHFNADQIVVLRWGGTGMLGADERYVVRVRDRDRGEDYEALVTELWYQLPGGWQPVDRNRHTFEWTISIAVVDAQYNILSEEHVAGPQSFTWDSR